MMGWFCQLFSNFCLYFRMYKLFRTGVCVFLLVVYCEFVHYYMVLFQCTWPQMNASLFGHTFGDKHQELRVMVLADTHLLGSDGHWFDKLRRESQMERAFQASMLIHSPDVVFVLGDLLDEGQWASDKDFKEQVERFRHMFSTSRNTEMHVLVGNHDVGFHYAITQEHEHRFEKAFSAPPVRMLRIQGNLFVLVNSMTMEGDGCTLCKQAVDSLQDIAQQLKCDQKGETSSSSSVCHKWQRFPYTKPILLQHFPMFRYSDTDCNTPDKGPAEEMSAIYRPKWDCVSEEATKQLFDWLQPRLVISGHRHYGCHRIHDNGVPEFTIASYNWRNINTPSFLLMTVTNGDFAVKRCMMPEESTVIAMYIIGAVIIFISLICPRKVVKFNTDKAH